MTHAHLADLLGVQAAEPYRVQAYRHAAQSVRDATAEVASVALDEPAEVIECLRADTGPVANIGDCSDPSQEFTEPTYDPVLRQVTYRLPIGQRLSENRSVLSRRCGLSGLDQPIETNPRDFVGF